jgi:hypothetical protein
VLSVSGTRHRTSTPGAGYTRRSEIQSHSGQLASVLSFQEQTVATPGVVTVNGTLAATADWGAIAVEIKP